MDAKNLHQIMLKSIKLILFLQYYWCMTFFLLETVFIADVAFQTNKYLCSLVTVLPFFRAPYCILHPESARPCVASLINTGWWRYFETHCWVKFTFWLMYLFYSMWCIYIYIYIWYTWKKPLCILIRTGVIHP